MTVPGQGQTVFWFARELGSMEMLHSAQLDPGHPKHAYATFTIGVVDSGGQPGPGRDQLPPPKQRVPRFALPWALGEASLRRRLRELFRRVVAGGWAASTCGPARRAAGVTVSR